MLEMKKNISDLCQSFDRLTISSSNGPKKEREKITFYIEVNIPNNLLSEFLLDG
jgi:hypothetical protein